MRWAVLAMVVVGGVLRVLIARQDLFADEVATYWIVSTRSLAGVVRTVSTTAEISPPLSFVLSWLTTRVGLGPMLVRLPALIAGSASIPLVYAVGVRTVGRRAALLAAALTTLSPFMVFYSAEARGYAVAMAMVLLSTLTLLLAIDRGRPRFWVAHAGFVCLAAYTHYTVVFVLAIQFGWAFWAYPRCRRALLAASAAAAVFYLPWLPSLQADLNSPTTKILSSLYPFDLNAARQYLEHWGLGYPYPGHGRDVTDLPGVPALVMLGTACCSGAYGVFTMRSRLRSRVTAGQGRVILVVLLALATPAGLALSSALGNHLLSTRNLAASWPYLALAASALITAGRPVLRITAATLAIAAFGLGAAGMLRTDFRRPAYSDIALWVNTHVKQANAKGVVVDAAVLTPGPLTNFDVEGSEFIAPVIRLGAPAQKTVPFDAAQPRPDAATVARRAAAAAGDGPIVYVARRFAISAKLLKAFLRKLDGRPLPTFVDLLPKPYTLTDRKVVGGLDGGLEAQVYCPSRRPHCFSD